MEILGNENNADYLMNSVEDLTKQLLLSANDADTISLTLSIVDILLDCNDVNTLSDSRVFALSMILTDSVIVEYPVILKNMIKELNYKLIRCRCFDSSLSGNVPNTAKTSTCLKSNVITREREQFLPSDTEQFFLPPVGQTTNLTVTTPDNVIGKTLIREIIIDHEGYLVSEISRRYEDVYSDVSEVAYTKAYLKELEDEKKAEVKQ